jgi:CheY-like chemotaxis protein
LQKENTLQNSCFEPGLSAKSLHILLAEDNIPNQILTARILKRGGHSVKVANNGEEALDTLKKEHFDLVLMDIQMPKMDGIEAARIIRNSKNNNFDPDIPIIAITAHALEEHREICMKAGMNDFISKPFESEDIQILIRLFAQQHKGV